MVQQVPAFPHLKENPPRKGFATEEQYAFLCKNCTELWLRALLAVSYRFGFRVGELLNLRVRNVNLFNRCVTLDPGSTKNDEARTIPLTAETYELLKACVIGKSDEDHVFSRDNGKPVRDFRVSWYKLCLASGLGKMSCSLCLNESGIYAKHCSKCKARLSYSGLLVHDQRRSAVRNMVRNDIPERVAMAISGHKPRSVFDRYNIVDDSDLADAARKLDAANPEPLPITHDSAHDSPAKQEVGRIQRVI